MIFVVIAIAVLPAILHRDPAPGLTTTRARSRSLECEWHSTAVGSQRYPGEIAPERPRGEYVNRDALVCTERLMRPGLRADRDEAVLSSLDALVTDLTGAAGDLHPELAAQTWLVEAYYPSTQVSAKLSFAAKNALVARGLRVSDRTPILSAGDVDVLTRLGPEAAYPGACRRYTDNGSLHPGDTLLAVVSRDPLETTLHAGLCTDGVWTWLK